MCSWLFVALVWVFVTAQAITSLSLAKRLAHVYGQAFVEFGMESCSCDRSAHQNRVPTSRAGRADHTLKITLRKESRTFSRAP